MAGLKRYSCVTCAVNSALQAFTVFVLFSQYPIEEMQDVSRNIVDDLLCSEVKDGQL